MTISVKITGILLDSACYISKILKDGNHCSHFSTSKPKVFTFMNMTTIEEILPPEGFDSFSDGTTDTSKSIQTNYWLNCGYSICI
jgi:hypothetical protein